MIGDPRIEHAHLHMSELAADDARTAFNSWQPVDPVKYTDPWETDQPPEPIYSARDLAEYQRLCAALQAAMHHLGQRRMAYQWDQFRAQAEATIRASELWVAEATASAVWNYKAPEHAELRKFDSDFMARVALEAQMMYATQQLPAAIEHRASRQRLEEIKSLVNDGLQVSLTEYVYGYPHKPIQTRATHTFETRRPKSWWQMFKRDVLKRGTVVEVVDFHTFEMAVSAKPFSAFPELPFKVDKKWGPRIDLIIPQSMRISRPNDFTQYTEY